MRPVALLFVILTVVLLGISFWLFRPDMSSSVTENPGVDQVLIQPSSSEETVHKVNLVLEAGRRSAGPPVIQVRQGEKLRLQVSSDNDGELHLHGYDLHLNLVAGKVVTLEWVANLSGRFEYELHGQHHGTHEPLGVVEVLPR